MKTPRLTSEMIERSIHFLERRRDHARVTKNSAWLEEYENAFAIVTGLAAVPRK